MKILMITSEAMPFAKTGGLADSVTSLANYLKDSGHDVKICMPRYYGISTKLLKRYDEIPMGVPTENGEVLTAVYTATTETPGKNKLDYYFIDYEKFYGRDGIYGTRETPDYEDNPQRFSLLCNAAFRLCKKLDWYPDIMHSHDWPTALVPVLLKFYERKTPEFEKTRSVFTIHNLGYQGIYKKDLFPVTCVEWKYYYSAGFEDWENMNFIKAGIQTADIITTVSPTYAKEIQTPKSGFRLDALLKYRSKFLYGILNGVDTSIWNPMTDTSIPSTYSSNTLSGKEVNKIELQKMMGLEVNPEIPLIGMTTRFADQKGITELFAPNYGCCQAICNDMRVQFVILGSGETWCENELRKLESELPNLKAYIGYNEKLAHLIEAGSDFFLSPSKYEPCGYNQMYSQLYGTIPIVRKTGGLADTVENYNEKTGAGSGFMLNDLTPRSIYDTVGWAVFAWYNKPNHIQQMRRRIMLKDFTWKKSAKEYVEIYKKALDKKF